jgi:hypothetical protein
MALLRNKDGALELSIGTIVIIVIGMSMLILGLVLVRTIFEGSTDSVNVLNEGVQKEIVGLFQSENSDISILLNADRTLKIKKGDSTNIGFGARPSSGASVSDSKHLNFKVELPQSNGADCIKINGATKTKEMIRLPLDVWREFSGWKPSGAFGDVWIDAPEEISECVQEVYIDVREKEEDGSWKAMGRENFYIKVISGGIF